MQTKKAKFLRIARIETPYSKTRIIKTPQESITIYATNVHPRKKKQMKATTDATLKREKQKYFLLKFHNFPLVRLYSILKVPRGTICPTAPYKMTTIHDENTPIDRLGKKKEKMQHIWQYRYMRIWNGCGTTEGEKIYNKPREAVSPRRQSGIAVYFVFADSSRHCPSKLRLSILSCKNKARICESQ